MHAVLYHNVIQGPLDEFDRAAGRTDVGDFCRQMESLLARFDFVTPAKLLQVLETGEPHGQDLLLTFDDGHHGLLVNAMPVLRALGITAIVFVVTHHVRSAEMRLMHFDELEAAFRWTPVRSALLQFPGLGPVQLDCAAARVDCMQRVKQILKTLPEQQRSLLHGAVLSALKVDAAEIAYRGRDDERFRTMAWCEMRSMMAAGFAFGGHTRSHRTVSQLADEEAVSEIAGCFEDLREGLDVVPTCFAYPYGQPEHVGNKAPVMVREAGFACAFTTTPGPVRPEDDRFRLSRNYYQQMPRADIKSSFSARQC